MASPQRIVLIGSSGAGKSATGNLILGQGSATPFRVSHGIYGATSLIQEHPATAQNWVVVDTPGLGDEQQKADGATDEEHRAQTRERRTAYFEDFTKHLRTYGGAILYIKKAGGGRTTAVSQRHLKAVSKLLCHLFPSAVMLIVTGVPIELLTRANSSTAEKESIHERYTRWLAKHKEDIEQGSGVSFVLAAGLTNKRVPADHPASKSSFLSMLHSIDLVLRTVPPRMTPLWSEVVSNTHGIASTAAALAIATNTTRTKLNSCEQQLYRIQSVQGLVARLAGIAPGVLPQLEVQLLALLQRLGYVSTVAALTGVAGAVTIAAVIATVAAVAFFLELKQQQLTALVEALTTALHLQDEEIAELTNGAGEEHARANAAEIERLVYQ
jgi:AIG1 family